MQRPMAISLLSPQLPGEFGLSWAGHWTRFMSTMDAKANELGVYATVGFNLCFYCITMLICVCLPHL
jgi:hypothetical protein